jgi:hypothetical protein
LELSDPAFQRKEQLGAVNARLAKKSGGAQYVREACHWYDRGLEVLRDLQRRGALGQDDVEEMKSLAVEVLKCGTGPKASDPATQHTDVPADGKK